MTTHLSRAALAAMVALAFGAARLEAADDVVETPAAHSSADFASLKVMVDAGRYAEALPGLQALDSRTPDNPDVLNLIGFSLRKTGHPDRALAFYNHALALKPDHRGANEYLGELFLELKQPDKARERLAALHEACGDCGEYRELAEKVEIAARSD